MFTIDPTSARFSREFRAFLNNQGNRYTDDFGRPIESVSRRGMGGTRFLGSPSMVFGGRPGTLTHLMTEDDVSAEGFRPFHGMKWRG